MYISYFQWINAIFVNMNITYFQIVLLTPNALNGAQAITALPNCYVETSPFTSALIEFLRL